MARNCVKYPLEGILKSEYFAEVFSGIETFEIEFYIDKAHSAEIREFLTIKKKKLRQILYVILRGKYDKAFYRKEKVSRKAKNVTAMKFSRNPNSRIYCKEFFIGNTKKIVMIYLLINKDFQKAQNKKIKGKLEAIGGYEYGF